MLLFCSSHNPQNILPRKDSAINAPSGGHVHGQFPPSARNVALIKEGQIERFREMFKKIELSVSAYDTAWIALVPSINSKKEPHFPNYLNWILENQQPDGSWAPHLTHPLLIKDSLTATLACVLALHKWNASQQLVDKGLDFIMSNVWAATDEHQHSPVGFDIIFPGMIQYARDLGLCLPLNQSSLDKMLLKRDFYTSFEGETRRLAYCAEGLMGSHHWKEIMKYQRNNGSLFNSPSTTAAALVHQYNGKCFDYLTSVVKNFDNAAPTIYPFDIYTGVSIIDNLKKLGIDRYFDKEIERVLEDVYRCWKQGSEEIFLDTKCCAMGFRLLREKGYEVSSDALSGFEKQQTFFQSALEHEKDIRSILELYKASQMTIMQNEHVLDEIHDWTSTYLKEKLVNGQIQNRSLHVEVDYSVTHPHAGLERIDTRNYIEHYDVNNISLIKTSYRVRNVDNRDLLTFSFQDFNLCQSMHQKELDHLEGWVKKYRIDQLKFARQKIRYAYFAIASDLFHPDQADARASWAQNSVLTTVVDDFFDFAGSIEEQVNLIALLEKWDDHSAIEFKSKDVEILFNAIYGTINELADKARKHQGRCVISHLFEIWITMLKTMLVEAEWAQKRTVPTMYEYLSNGYVSFALGPIILTSIYLMGHTLSEEVIASQEYSNLFMHISMIGRLTNDRVTVEREGSQGKLNSVSLQVVHGRGAVTKEDAQEEVSRLIASHRRALLGLVLQKKGSKIPRACKDVFWTMSKVLHLFYKSDDAYSSQTKMVQIVSSIINEPIVVPIRVSTGRENLGIETL